MENKPWLPYLVTDYIRQLKPKRVFEWGSGESTLFFANLPKLERLVSIEHDHDYYEDLWKKLGGRSQIDLRFISFDKGEIGPNPADPEHYKSGSTNLGEVNFKRYCKVIDDYGLFDLILIDGMARASCLTHAISHVKSGGCIVLDNTGDRPYYLEKTEELFGNYESGWEKIKFMGYGPSRS